MDYRAKKLLLLAVLNTQIRASSHYYEEAILRSNNLAIAPNIYKIITYAGRNAFNSILGAHFRLLLEGPFVKSTQPNH